MYANFFFIYNLQDWHFYLNPLSNTNNNYCLCLMKNKSNCYYKNCCAYYYFKILKNLLDLEQILTL